MSRFEPLPETGRKKPFRGESLESRENQVLRELCKIGRPLSLYKLEKQSGIPYSSILLAVTGKGRLFTKGLVNIKRGKRRSMLTEVTQNGYIFAYSKGIWDNVDDFIYGSGLLDRSIGEKTHPTIIDIYRKIAPKLCAQINPDFFDQIDIEKLCKKLLSTAIMETVEASKESDATTSISSVKKFLNEIRSKADKEQSIKLTKEIIQHLSYEQKRISQELQIARMILDIFAKGKIPSQEKMRKKFKTH